MAYGGSFFIKNRDQLAAHIGAAMHTIGHHALIAAESASDGGALSIAVGRLRNARELAQEFDAPGASDARLALIAYRRYGEGYPAHLEGPVISCTIDIDQQRLILSRDRMGDVPLFYTYKGGSVAFAHHPQPLIESGVASRRVDRDGARELFGLGPALTPGKTPFEGIFTLEPGTALIAHAHGHETKPYYRLEAREHEHDERRTIDEVRMLIERAIDDARPYRPASMLSGGLDSTALTALLSKGGPVSTWSVDYEDSAQHFSGNDFQIARDQPFVEMATRHIGADHRNVVLSSQSLADGLRAAMRARGMPGMGDIDSSLLLFAAEIGKYHSHALSGECGDEVFGGYPWFRREDMIFGDGFPWSGSIALRERILKPAVRDVLKLEPFVCERYHESVCGLPRLGGEDPKDARLRMLQGLCFRWFMPNLQLRAAMMCSVSGLQVITPFSDERLAEYVYNVPWAMKTMRGHEKGLLRMAAQDLLPHDLLWRKKSPYPKTHHPAYTALMRERTKTILEDSAAPLWHLADRAEVERLAASALNPKETPWFGQLMSGPQLLAYLIQLNDWLTEYNIELDLG